MTPVKQSPRPTPGPPCTLTLTLPTPYLLLFLPGRADPSFRGTRVCGEVPAQLGKAMSGEGAWDGSAPPQGHRGSRGLYDLPVLTTSRSPSISSVWWGGVWVRKGAGSGPYLWLRKGRQSLCDLGRGFLRLPFCGGSGSGRNPGRVHSGSWGSRPRPGCGDTGSEPPVWLHTLPGSLSALISSCLLPSRRPAPGLSIYFRAVGREGRGRAGEQSAGKCRPWPPSPRRRTVSL